MLSTLAVQAGASQFPETQLMPEGGPVPSFRNARPRHSGISAQVPPEWLPRSDRNTHAGHPTADGRLFGDLRQAGLLDGHPLHRVETVPYSYTETYDILPASESGAYFATGMLIGSTLAP
jgi:hypothetical protein